MIRTIAFCCFLLPTVAVADANNAPSRIAAIHVSEELLARVDAVIRDIQTNAESLDLEKLRVSYKDGKSLEEWRKILQKHTFVALDVSGKIRRADTVSLPIILLEEISNVRESMKELSDELGKAGEHSNSGDAVLASVPFIQFEKRLIQPTNDLEDRISTITAVADLAIRQCGTK